MVVTESCENNAAVSNGPVVLNGHAREDLTNGTMSKEVVSQNPERIDETKECLVQRKVSLRLQNRAKVKYDKYQKWSMSNGSNEKKKTKLNPSMQQQAYYCRVMAGGVDLVSNFTNAFPQGMDLRTILRLKEILRLVNLKKLQSAEEEHNRSNNEENNNMGAVEFSKGKIRSTRFLYDNYPWYAISSTQGFDFPTMVCKDISNGQEDITIPVINEHDFPPVVPAGFEYIKSLQISEGVKVPSRAYGCQCKRSCTRTRACSCINLNNGSIAYYPQKGGRLIFAKNVVFECGPSCGCGPDCGNRVSQKGIKYHLEVFRTPNKGWGVRTLDNIASGAAVCEYIGVLRKREDLDSVTNNDYLFDLDCRQTIEGIEGREKRFCSVSLPATNPSDDKKDDKTTETEPKFCIDSRTCGNVSRFINHSCDPNLFVQCVLSSHHDINLARLVLFAAEEIRPYQELTCDYGYRLDSVVDSDGNIKQKPCNCGAANCRKRLY